MRVPLPVRLEASRAARRARVAGWTLIEILAVIAILGLLMSLAIYNFSKPKQAAARAATISTMAELANLIERFQTTHGDYPPSHLAELKIKAPNDTNEGAESLYCALHAKTYTEGTSMSTNSLVNTDDDSSQNFIARDGSSVLMEPKDGWNNPIAYIHFKDYGKQFNYRMGDNSDPEQAEQVVQARKSKKTGVWANAESYQLISAGPDGKFGTDDDVTNFDQ